MDPTQKTPQPFVIDTTPDKGPTQAAADPNIEASRSLIDAEARLMEAEAKLLKRDGERSGEPSRTPSPSPNARPSPTMETVWRPVAEQPPKERAPREPATQRLPENVAGVLCYLFGWITGLIFLLVDRRPFVRFHAAQSVAVFATLTILLLAFGSFFLGAIFPGAAGALLVVRRALWLVWFVSEVVLMLKAAGGEKFGVRFASQYADRAAHGAR